MQALTVVVVVYLNGWAGLVEVGEGGRTEEGLVWSWSENGWEPLVQRSYWCCFTQPSVAHAPLTDLKGDTSRGVTKDGELGG